MSAETSYSTPVETIEKTFGLLRTSVKPRVVGLLDHHGTSNNVAKRIIRPVMRKLAERGIPLKQKQVLRYPPYEHPIQDVVEIQREVIKNHLFGGKHLDQILEVDWPGAAGIKMLSSWEITLILTTGALGKKQLEDIRGFYEEQGLLDYIRAIIGRTNGDPVPVFKERNALIFLPNFGIEDSLRTGYYSYALNGIDSYIIDPNNGGYLNLCPSIEETPYHEVVQEVLKFSPARDKDFKQRMFGPFKNIGIAALYISRNIERYRKEAERNWNFRRSIPEEEIPHYINNLLQHGSERLYK